MPGRYVVMVKASGKWATPWTFDTWQEAKQQAAVVRAGAFYEGVKVRKESRYCECPQSEGYGRASDGSLYCVRCGKRT